MFDLKLGFKCNNNCKHCVVADKRLTEDIPLKEIFSYMEEASLYHDSIQITGGEPSIYKILPTVLQKAKSLSLYTVIQTNATGFSDYSFLEQCAPFMDHAHIAIHSSDATVHDTIVGTSGMWEKTIQGLKNIQKFPHILITTQTVISKYNADTLKDTFSFIQNLIPGTRMSLTYPHLMGNAYTNRDSVALRYSDIPYLKEILEKFSNNLYTEAIPLCYLYPYIDIPSTEGGLLEVGIYRTGYDPSQGFVNYNQTDLINRKKAPLCKNCILNNKCIGVWKEYIDLYKSELDLYPILEDFNLNAKNQK